jgi:large subunit ribosomal protein L15
MKLNQLRPREGSTHPRKLLGRGIGSGLGKTSGRGVKGQKARTGVSINGFEGGQMPLFRRLPKRGFTSIGRRKFVPLNVGTLQAAVDAGRIDPSTPVTAQSLVEAGVVRRAHDGVRLLGDGELTAKLTIEVAYASASARAAVEKAGGSVKMLEAERAAARVATPMKGTKPPGKKPARHAARAEAVRTAIAKAIADASAKAAAPPPEKKPAKAAAATKPEKGAKPEKAAKPEKPKKGAE